MVRRDTKSLISAAAAELFIERGYEKTTLRMIAQRIGISHVSILGHFASKREIASQTMQGYLNGLLAKCNELLPTIEASAEVNADCCFHMLLWNLHFKILADNPGFRRYYISYLSSEPILLQDRETSLAEMDTEAWRIVLPKRDAFITSTVMTAVDVNFAKLIDAGVTDSVLAATIVFQLAMMLGYYPDYQLQEEDLRSFAERYLTDVRVDLLHEFYLTGAAEV